MIVAVIRDGAENEGTDFDNGDVVLALCAVSGLLKEAEAASQRLYEFWKAEGV